MMRKLLSVLACIGVMLMSQNAYAAMSYDQALQYQIAIVRGAIARLF